MVYYVSIDPVFFVLRVHTLIAGACPLFEEVRFR